MIHPENRAFCATGQGGGVDNTCSPKSTSGGSDATASPKGPAVDATWMYANDSEDAHWDSDKLKVRSPVAGGEKLASFSLERAGIVSKAIELSDLNLNAVVALNGGAVRGAHVRVSSYEESMIEVSSIIPIDPDDASQGYISSAVEIVRDDDTGELSLLYGSLFPMKEVKVDDRTGEAYTTGDMSPSSLTASQRSRIASILMERFAESVAVAEKSGFSYAEMLAVGSNDGDHDKGYRLWPQFGFDGPLPPATLKMVPDEIALKAAGIKIPAAGSSRIPQETVIKGLRSRVQSLSIQQLISTPDGDKWWNENGHSIELRLDFGDKKSLGYARLTKMKAKIKKLRDRNKSRSLFDLFIDLVERRDDCGRQDGGRFGPGNDCASDEGGNSELSEETGTSTISSVSSVPITSGKQWRRADDMVMYRGKDIPAKALSKAESVTIVNGKLLSDTLKDMSLSLDTAAKICAATQEGSSVVACHGLLSDARAYFDNPDDPPEAHMAVTFFSKVDIGGIDNAVAVGTTLAVDEDDAIILSYGMLDVTDEAKNASPVAIAREMYRSVSQSITEAEKAGVDSVEMLAAGSSRDGDKFRGYRIWPRMGFDGVIPRERITPTYTVMYGFFNRYGSNIPDRILSPRAVKEKKAGALTIQALYETQEGQEWWEKNGGAMEMRLAVSDKQSAGWKRFSAMRDKLSRRHLSLSDDEYFGWLDYEWREMVSRGDVEVRSDDCGRDGDGRFGDGNKCAAAGSGESSLATGDDSWKSSPGRFKWDKSSTGRSPIAGGDAMESVHISDTQMLKSALKNVASVGDIDSVVAIAGGTRQGGRIEIDCPNEYKIAVSSVLPVSPDGSASLGTVQIGVSIRRFKSPEWSESSGVFYSEMILDRAATSAMSHSGNDTRVASLVMQRMTESLVAAEKAGISIAETDAAGDRDSDLKGYRLWPTFGFDGEVPHDYDGLREFIERSISNRELDDDPPSWAVDLLERIDSEEPVSIQQLVSSREGERWWGKNGSDTFMSLDFSDKNSLGYKRFKDMQARIESLKGRNQGRSLSDIDFVAEVRSDDCGRTPDGKFGPKNDCATDGGTAAEDSGKKAASPKAVIEPPSLPAGRRHPDAFDEVRRSPPATRDASGTLSSKVYSSDDISSFAGKQYASPEAVGRYLTNLSASHRGRDIDSHSELSGDDFEFMVSSLTEQVQSATARGHTPAFYSQQELKKQIGDYAQLHPVLKGGVTASGVCIGKKDSSGNCQPTDSITPEGEFLFRAVQALTSPQANPWLNMQRADDVLTHFLTEPDPSKARLDKAPVGGNVMQVTKGSLTRLQAIIDKVGLDGAAELFSGPPMRAGDIERFFEGRLGLKDFSVGGYGVNEVVPLFSVFGPKVGPFFANNNGDYESLTADVWFTRTWGRTTGELISETNPELAKTHAKELLSASRLKHITDEDLGGVSLEEFTKSLEVMKKTGDIPASVQGWAEARFKRYGKEGFNKGTKGVRNQEVARLSRRILQNLVKVNDQPDTTVQRSNMIKVMREVSSRTGFPQAFCQDLLWQDEQDVWAAAGARTFTEIGEPSLYSTGIEKMVRDPSTRLPVKKAAEKAKKKSKRSIDQQQDEGGDIVWIGDYQQLLFEDDLQDVSAEEFASAFVKHFGGEGVKQSRNFDALDFGSRVSAFVGGVIKGIGIDRWQGGSGEHAPALPSGAVTVPSREEHRGDAKAPPGDRIKGSDKNADGSAKNQSGAISLSESTVSSLKSKAEEHNASMRKRNRPSWTHVRLPALKSVYRRGAGAFSTSHRPGMTRDQWAMARVNAFLYLARRGRPENAKYVGDNDLLNSGHPRYSKSSRDAYALAAGASELRAFCPTGAGGGIDNSCSSGDSGAAASPLHSAAERITFDDINVMTHESGVASEDVAESVALLATPRRFELVGSVAKSMPRSPAEAGEYAKTTINAFSAKGKPLPSDFVEELASRVSSSISEGRPSGTSNADPQTAAVCLVATVVASVVEYPEMADAPIAARTSSEIMQSMLVSRASFAEAASVASSAAFYSSLEDKITLNTDNAFEYISTCASSAASEKDDATGKWKSDQQLPFFSTSQLSHVFVHEDGHRIHWQSLRQTLGIDLGKTLSPSDPEAKQLILEIKKRGHDLLSHLQSNGDAFKKMISVSGYSRKDPQEFVAEYYTALRLGRAKRDKDLDKVMEILGFPADKLPEGKSPKGKGSKK